MSERIGFLGRSGLWGVVWMGWLWCCVTPAVAGVVAGAGDRLAPGQAALQARQYVQARQLFTQILSNREAAPGERSQALEGRCAALLKQSLEDNQVDLARQAVADCSEAIRLNPNQVSVWRLRGLARLVTGQVEKALINFNRALQLEPDDAVSLRNRGVAYLGMGRLTEADADLNAALRLDADQAWAYFNRGVLAGRVGQIAKAEADFREFVRLRGAKAIEFLALLLQDKQEKSGVRAAVEVVLQENVLAIAAAVPKVETPEPEAVEPVAAPAEPVAAPVEPVAAPVEPVAVAVQSPASAKEYLFKMGSYQDRENVVETLQAIKTQGLPTFEEKVEVEGRLFYRIWVGPFGEESAAKAALARLSRLPGQHPEGIVER